MSVVQVLLVTSVPGGALAAWPSSSVVNVPVCTAANSQLSPVISSDGSGGAIVVWADQRAGAVYDVYAQHVRFNGAVDAGWPANGIGVCTATGDQINVRVVTDGSGGAIAAWQDSRSGTGDIYAQRILASGAVDPAWTVNGVAVCAAAGSQTSPVVVSDGAGGAIIAWLDSRGGTTTDVYAQHVLASGLVDGGWPVAGRALCTAVGNQQRLAITSDGLGGAIVVWQDFRGGTTADIYASRVLASGAVDPVWPSDGLVVCDAIGSQLVPDVVGSSQHGALVTWHDFRGGATSDVYAQRVLVSGGADPAWTANGVLLCSASESQTIARSVPDGAGGAIVAWQDARTVATGADLYAQHIRVDGVVDPAWPLDGRALCTAFGSQANHTIAPDGAGGAIVAWEDGRVGQSVSDVYAQHVSGAGAVDPLWPSNGRAICTAAAQQTLPVTLADGSGGAILAWADFRTTGGASADIYAQRVQADGQLGGDVLDVPSDRHPPLTLEPLRPNPWHAGPLTLRYALAYDAAATLDVIDAAGRRVAEHVLHPQSGMAGIATFEFQSRPAAGVYFARLRQGRHEQVKRFVVLE